MAEEEGEAAAPGVATLPQHHRAAASPRRHQPRAAAGEDRRPLLAHVLSQMSQIQSYMLREANSIITAVATTLLQHANAVTMTANVGLANQ